MKIAIDNYIKIFILLKNHENLVWIISQKLLFYKLLDTNQNMVSFVWNHGDSAETFMFYYLILNIFFAEYRTSYCRLCYKTIFSQPIRDGMWHPFMISYVPCTSGSVHTDMGNSQISGVWSQTCLLVSSWGLRGCLLPSNGLTSTLHFSRLGHSRCRP